MIFEKGKSPCNGGVAQLGEHLPCKQGVMGSNPIISTSRQCRHLIPEKGRGTHGIDGKNQQLRTVCSSGG